MGCFNSTASSPSSTFKVEPGSLPMVQNHSEIAKVKKQLQQQLKKVEQYEVRNNQIQNDLQMVNQKGLFPSRFVGLHFIHNFLMLVREGRLDKGSLLILDVRKSNPQAFNDLHIMKSQIFTIPEQSQKTWQDSIQQLKTMIHFKHVFVIGDGKQDFESDSFSALLKAIVQAEMKPFCLYLHRLKPELATSEYAYLIILQNQSRKLALYPQIISKCKDLGVQESKKKFQLLLGPSRQIYISQFQELGITRCIVIDDESGESLKYIQDNLASCYQNKH
ncbi:hypothetical protein FGO68_gene442 [Halteria grandinella]|uniref:Uncharacterized protein n=1 Tax=Halteria grandinella TaxID=5974 RepID=A0A8J8P203_HALGN|nr:hypothetical protein FGO68_gene442 [Halteria grandinella]